MLGLFLFVVFIVVATAMIVIPVNIVLSKKKKIDIEETLASYENFISKNGMKNCQTISFRNFARMDIDKRRKLIGVFSYYEGESIIFGFDEILDFEMFENGNSIISSKSGSTVAGGLLFGSLGAMAGASGSRTVNDVCKSLKLKIYTSDLENSVVVIDFLEHEIYKTNSLYEEIIETIDKMISFLKIAVEKNKQKERKKDKKIVIEKVEKSTDNVDLSQLEKLSELKDKGIITDKEFEEKKKKILSKI